MRKLVTFRNVKELTPIEGADRIELAKIDGWQCVVKKGDFEVGDQGLFFEIDSLLPSTDSRFAFMAPRKFRVKTMKLKGALSQGLLMPTSILTFDEAEQLAMTPIEVDMAKFLGVILYEPPVPIAGKQKGTFPLAIVPKTDQERIQNIPDMLNGTTILDFEVTEKLDGTSCTIWMHVPLACVMKHASVEEAKHAAIGVASRNWEMQKDDENVYAKMLRENYLVDKLWQLGRNIAIQGEIVGPAVQGNKYQLAKQELYVFDIYDIDAKKYLSRDERHCLVVAMELKHAPILNYYKIFANAPSAQPIQHGDENRNLTLDLVLEAANGKSELNPNVMREGLVFKRTDGSFSFKAISNEWLLKYE